MKKIYFSLLSVVLGLGLNAQTLTQTNNAPANGDMYSTYQVDSTGISPGAAGAGVTWNFASAVTHSNIVNNYTAVTVSNSSYPNANVAVSSSTSNLSFYSTSSVDWKYWGGNLSIGGVAATLNYTSPSLNAAYPMSIGTTSAATTAGSLVVLGQNGTFTGNSKVTLDGTGTLNTPAGTFANAMRVVTSQTINFTAGILTGVVTQVNYDYYTSGTKAPMFTISTSSLTTNLGAPSQQTVVTRHAVIPTAIKSINASSTEVSVYPNPSASFVNFTTGNGNAVSVIVLDLNGKLIENRSIVNGSLKLDVSNYANGIYSYQVVGANKIIINSSKFVVAH